MRVGDEIERLYDPDYSSCAVIVDALQDDHPIIFTTAAFTQVTGYAREDVVGMNCRFLQGPETCPEAIARIRHAIANVQPIKLDLVNYAKDGRKLMNTLRIRPFFDEDGALKFFGGHQIFTPFE